MELNNGGKIPNCNEGVNSGVGKPFIKLGRESNEGSELGETSDALLKMRNKILKVVVSLIQIAHLAVKRF